MALSRNCGFKAVVRFKDVFRVAAPAVEFADPVTVTVDAPAGVVSKVEIERVTFAGEPAVGETVEEEKLQVAPAGKPLQERVTTLLKEPDALTVKLIGWEPVPRARAIVEGFSADKPKSTT